jgi:hypothetical protein
MTKTTIERDVNITLGEIAEGVAYGDTDEVALCAELRSCWVPDEAEDLVGASEDTLVTRIAELVARGMWAQHRADQRTVCDNELPKPSWVIHPLHRSGAQFLVERKIDLDNRDAVMAALGPDFVKAVTDEIVAVARSRPEW